MAREYHHLVGQSGTYSSTGPKIDLTGFAKADHQTFGAKVTDGATVTVVIRADPFNLLVWEATFADLGTDTLTRVTELEAVGSISNFESVDVYLINDAPSIEAAHYASRGFIEGLGLEYVNGSSIKCLEGRAVVNGETLEVAAAGTTTASGDALSLATNSQGDLLYVYLYNNAGTVQMHWEIGSSGAPVWDSDLDYAKHPVDGASKRFIGAVFVGQSTDDTIEDFNYIARGRERHYHPHAKLSRVLSAGSATASTSIDCSAYLPDVSVGLAVGITLATKMAGSPGTDVVFIVLGQTAAQCTLADGLQVAAEMDNASKSAAAGPLPLGYNSTTFYYRVDDANTEGVVDLNWFEFRV